MNPALLSDRDDEDYPRPLKRQKTSYANTGDDPLYDRYTIAWICALHFETAAALAMMDEIHGQLPRRFNDNNAYTLGSIKNHNIVIACLPHDQYGKNNAAHALTNIIRTFPSIRRGLVVGIGGGAPGKVDIRLGDIVVGTRIMQYDFGRVLASGEIQRTAIPKIPEYTLRTAVTNLRAKHEIYPSRVPAILQERIQEHINYHRPSAPDHLFQASYAHDPSMANCQACNQSQLKEREERRSREPKVHYGGIASSNQVMKDAVTRDKLAQELDIICFEMEAAGLMDVLPCLPIRGICDYSDSHKAKDWQRYAAAVAAAYAREFLEALPAASDTSRDSYPNTYPPEQGALGDRRQQLLEALRFEEIDSRKTTIKAAHFKTCRWFLKHPDYLEWLDSKKQSHHLGLLWIRGKPGAGKSIIMKFIYTKIKKTDIPMKALTVSFFFNARGGFLEKSVLGMYRSLLLQLLEGFPDLQRILDDPDLISHNKVTCPPLNVLKDLFRSAVTSLERRNLTCFVDALNECDEQQVKDMVEFFEELAEQCVENNVRFQVCFSSRHYPYIDIKSGIRLILECQDGHIEDLKSYINNHLRIPDPALVNELKQMILDKAAGVFLWVTLVVDILNTEDRRGCLALRRRLQGVPSQLSELFKDILTRDQEHMEDLLLSILWILLAERPLKPGEYYHALWSGLSLKGLADLEMPIVNTSDASDCFNKCIISSSRGLAEITKAKKPTVQFIHESVRDFLIKDKGLYQLWPELGVDWESQAHERLKLCCNAYVFHRAIGKAIDGQQSTEAESIKDDLLKQFLFLEYASQYVLGHANAAAYKITQQRFISEFPVSNWVRIFNIFEKHKVRKYSEAADILYILADRGYPELIRMRLEVNPGIDGGGGRYCHPLLAAMAKGHKDSVIALLGLSSSIHNGIDITDGLKSKIDSVKTNHTPVSWACEEGHLAIARFLLDRGAQVGVDDFVRFVGNGNIEVVKMLLETGADPAAAAKDGQTPLHQALRNGHFEIAKMLVEAGADVMAADVDGRIPLLLASENGQSEVAKMLLEKGAGDAPVIESLLATYSGTQTLLAAPQTDSGYISTVVDIVDDKKPYDDGIDDTRTEYSTTSSTNFPDQDTYIEKFAHHMASHTRAFSADQDTQARISAVLPSLLKAFALQVGHQNHTPLNRMTMAFVHRHRRKIAETFENIHFNQEHEDKTKVSKPSDNTTEPREDTMDRHDYTKDWVKSLRAQPLIEEHEQMNSTTPEPQLAEQSPQEEEESVDSPLLIQESAILRTTAFEWLLSRLLKQFQLTPMKPYAMQSINKKILSALPPGRIISRKSVPPMNSVSIEFDCRFFQFFEEQSYPRHPHEVFDDVITLTGSCEDAQAATCAQYLSQTWPSTAPHSLELIKDCLMVKPGCPRTMSYPDGTTLKARIEIYKFTAEVIGVAATVAEIGEQLAWLGATFRNLPEIDGIAYCTPDIDIIRNDSPSSQSTPEIAFKIQFALERVEDNPDTNGQCWQSLFKDPVIVKGYPIPRRNEWNFGLEASLDIMAGLAQADQIHSFNDKFYLKGYSTMLVPTRRSGDIQYWHLIHQTDGSRLSHFANYLTQKQYVGSLNDLEHLRHVLGWCSKTEPFPGLFKQTCSLVKSSWIPKCDESGALAGMSYTRGTRISKQCDFLRRANDIPPSLASNDYVSRLQSLEAQFFLLWDEKHKRGWLINGATALLYAVAESLAHAKNDNFRSEFSPKGHGSGKTCGSHESSAFEILNDERYQNLPLHSQKNSHITIKIKIEELCSMMEYFIDLQSHAAMTGRFCDKPRKDLEGWDFEDVVKNFRTFHPRKTTLEKGGKEWVDFIRGIKAVTLFGEDFGEIIKPSGLSHETCKEWATLPKGQYYIATCVSDLQTVFKEHGKCVDGHLRLGDDLIWHSITPGSEFCKCNKPGRHVDDNYRCEPVQICFPLRLADSLTSRRNQLPDNNDGALIFGHHSQFPWFWGDFGDPKEFPENEAPCSPRKFEKGMIMSPDSGIGSSLSRSQTESQARPRLRSEDSFAGPPFKKQRTSTTALPGESTAITLQEKCVGIICALPKELAAVKATFDVTLESRKKVEDDPNYYVTGKIAHHKVIATCLPFKEIGTNAAASTAENMRRSFNPSLCLLVGIGGGAPSKEHDIRLGDVVVGNSVVQYDFGSETEESFKIKDRVLQSSPSKLGNLISSMCSDPILIRDSISRYLAEIVGKDDMIQYRHPGHDRDILSQSCSTCRSFPQPCSHVREREQRKDSAVVVHYGKIASGNRVIRNAMFRDKVAANHNVMCFEMEAAGIANSMPYLVIRGISDYCDGNKNDEWHEYAAATAAAYSKLLLNHYHE
ncbi:ankyrin protein 3 [Fusarium denticulatum]|uniref:Ankyrin protein 3 n=1 Tax=Fusarium denticulatum TaxID=48507 RepID=A0A8H5U7N6_9HYPO|nr:ankyrin protein 3 [Fusarium denticulatum]